MLEVIIALAILAASAAVLGQMLSVATRHADRALEISDAQTVANNLMSDLLCGNLPWLGSETFQPVDEWSAWDYRVRIQPVGLGQLTAVQVTVVQRLEAATLASDSALSASSLPTMTSGADDFGGRAHYHLTRWVRRSAPSGLDSLDPLAPTNPGTTPDASFPSSSSSFRNP